MANDKGVPAIICFCHPHMLLCLLTELFSWHTLQALFQK